MVVRIRLDDDVSTEPSVVPDRVGGTKSPVMPERVVNVTPKNMLNVKHSAANKLLQGSQRHTLLYGGSRSAKTSLIVRRVIIRAMLATSRHAILRFRSNAIWPSIGLDTFPRAMARWFPHVRYNANKSLHYFALPSQTGGQSEIWLGGLDEKQAAEKILGNEFSTIYFNECSEIPYGSVTLARTRLAQVVSGLQQRAYYDLNPAGKLHWTYQEFFEHKNPDTNTSMSPELVGDFKKMQLNPKDNAENLDPAYLRSLELMPFRTRMRFWEGLYVDEVEGALWNPSMLDRCRVLESEVPVLTRIVVAVDPSGAKNDQNTSNDAIGIVVMGVGEDGHGYVLEDATILAGPNEWGRRAAALYHKYGADRMIGETNYGGGMVEFVIKTADENISYREVSASRGKHIRAEPVSALYGDAIDDKVLPRIHHVGEPEKWRRLEDELCGFSTVGYVGERSPNRADALVWAATELMLGTSFQGWLDFYANKAARAHGQAPVVVGRQRAKPAPGVTLVAPRAYAVFMPATGARYESGDDALIHGVQAEHVEALIRSGCTRMSTNEGEPE